MIELLKNAGPFAFLNVAAGAIGLLLAVVTLAMGKTNAAKVLGTLCLVGALVMLGLGFAGYFLGMTSTMAALGNVPDDQREMLLRQGTQESRGNFIVALAAALLPLLAGLVSALRTGFRPGMALAGITVVVAAAIGVQVASPLPPADPPLIEPPGLTLAQSSSTRGLRGAAVVGLTPDGLWASGVRVSTLAMALEDPIVKSRNTNQLPVLIDAKVKFSALADLVEAAEKAGRALELVVLAPNGERRVVTLYGASEDPPSKEGKPSLGLTVRITPETFRIGAVGGTLEPLPPDFKELNDKLAEVKSNFPDVDVIRMSADADVTMEVFVKALDAAVMRDGRLLFPRVIVGRFELVK